MNFNTVNFTFFDIPPYLFCAGIGFVISVCCYILLLFKKDLNVKDHIKAIYISVPGIIVGSKLFGIIKNLVNSLYNNILINRLTFLRSGIVYYGGLIGFLTVYVFYLNIIKKKRIITHNEYSQLMDCVAIVIPLFHFFGRIGCFTAGCCYGIENHSHFTILYTNYINQVIVTKERIPIQLIESLCNIIIFLILLFMFYKGTFKDRLLNIYFAIYPTIRFVLEFFRGDWSRNVAFGFSMSQYISAILLLLNIFWIIRNKGRDIDV